jgi:hypothetical protein
MKNVQRRNGVLHSSRIVLASDMKLVIPWIAAALVLALTAAAPGEKRSSLLPKLQPGQKITYLIRFRSEKSVKTESTVTAPVAPTAPQTDARGLLQLDVLDVQQTSGKPTIRARGRFLAPDSGAALKKPVNNNAKAPPRDDPAPTSIEFTISDDGLVRQVTGLDALSPDQQQAWQEWLARFAVAWTLPAEGVRIGDKWKSDQPEQSATPIASLTWERESQYVKDEPCRATQLSNTGEISSAAGAHDTCAVLLTTATLKQNSSTKDATPEDFKLHDLKTTGTAQGTNETFTYISLQTGLVVRATEEATQRMDVTVAKAEGSNRVHYKVDAKSHAEVLLVTDAPQNHP